MTRRFHHDVRMWLVDLDDLPRSFLLSRLLSFRAADHLGEPSRSIRENLTAWLATQGIPEPSRVRMLTTPRSFGYAFNPLTVYWCDKDDEPLCVVAEVHNTYGEQHCYLLHPDGRWRATTAKEFYVSPFLDVAGHYEMRLRPPDDRLSLAITLHQDGAPAFAATLTGRRIGPVTPLRSLTSALSLLPHRVRFLIQRHGVALWLRKLPVVPRPSRPTPVGR
jgi:DUF1365 family protein